LEATNSPPKKWCVASVLYISIYSLHCCVGSPFMICTYVGIYRRYWSAGHDARDCQQRSLGADEHGHT
jgi:hypothetical protein